jgi:hypothetical protein
VDRDVTAHVASCGECRLRFDQQQALTAGLMALAWDVRRATVSPHVEARLMRAFVARNPNPAASGCGLPLRWVPLAAAVVLCVSGAVWWSSRPAPDRRPGLEVRAAPSAPATTSVAAAPPSAGPDGDPGVRTTRRRRPAPRPAAPPVVRAVGFVPIPSAAGLPDFESGEIVRLGIPVTALPNYGLEIPAGVKRSVQADLLVGQDGRARAIRLVEGELDGLQGPE